LGTDDSARKRRAVVRTTRCTKGLFGRGFLDFSTRLAVDRTRLAHERTLMAWVRTATSLISFGFSVYKFFQFELSKEDIVAVLVSGLGVLALLLGAFEI
jgi:putative membrane protein